MKKKKKKDTSRQKEQDTPEGLCVSVTGISKNTSLLVILPAAVKIKSSQFCNQETINLGAPFTQLKVNFMLS